VESFQRRLTSFIPYYERTNNWTALAWWVHDNIPEYSEICFFQKLAAFNVSWHESPKKVISSYVPSKGILTQPGMPNFNGSHEKEYEDFLNELVV
jgi:hypothetical protein